MPDRLGQAPLNSILELAVPRKRTDEMSTGWRKAGATVLRGARDLVLIVLAFGAVQLSLSVGVWALLFRSHPQGFSMALSLVGFGGWFVAFTASFAGRRKVPWGKGSTQLSPGDRPPFEDEQDPAERARLVPASAASPTLVSTAQTQIGRFGCGTVLFLASLIPLGLAFILRVRADMQSGMTWNDIFPGLP